jgi:dynein heavy chain
VCSFFVLPLFPGFLCPHTTSSSPSRDHDPSSSSSSGKGANEEEEDPDAGEDDLYEVSGTKCGGHLLDSRLKELMPIMPVMYFKAVEVKSSWEACEVGYVRNQEDVYDCPCYSTTWRGPTYVVLATLKTIDPTWKWVLAGVAMIFQEDK